MRFHPPSVTVDKLLTVTKTRTQTAWGKILLNVIKCLGGQILSVWLIRTRRAGLICHLSYLKYLKAIDVKHTHDLMACFSLCLQGDNIVNIINMTVVYWKFDT